VHKTSGVRDPAALFPLPARRDDSADRRDANRAVAVSAAGLAAAGVIELVLALLLAVTAFICHVGWEVTADVTRRLADAVDPEAVQAAEAAAGSVPGVIHAHAERLPGAGSLTWAAQAAP